MILNLDFDVHPASHVAPVLDRLHVLTQSLIWNPRRYQDAPTEQASHACRRAVFDGEHDSHRTRCGPRNPHERERHVVTTHTVVLVRPITARLSNTRVGSISGSSARLARFGVMAHKKSHA